MDPARSESLQLYDGERKSAHIFNNPGSFLLFFLHHLHSKVIFFLQYFIIFLYTGWLPFARFSFLCTISDLIYTSFFLAAMYAANGKQQKKGRAQFSTLYFYAQNIFHHIEFPGRRFFHAALLSFDISQFHLYSTHLIVYVDMCFQFSFFPLMIL